jgi:hypothetical protein
VNLTPGPVWRSFELLRLNYAAQLASIKPGMVAQLNVKQVRVRIMRDEDFQALMRQAELALQMANLSGDAKLAFEAYVAAPSEAGLALLERITDRLMTLKDRK